MAKNPGGRQENTKGSKGSFSAGASPASGKQSVATGGGGGDGIAGFFSNLFSGGGGGGAPQNRMPDGSRMDTITKPFVGGKTAPNYGQVNLGMAAPGTPGLADKLALSAAAQAAASQPQGIMGVLGNLMPGSMAIQAGRGLMKHMRPASAFPPRFGPEGQMTPYGEMMQQRSQALAAEQLAASREGDGPQQYVVDQGATAPTSMDPTQIPGERPSWWPSYLPWPPAPNVSVPQTAVPAMGTQPTGSLPAPTPYGTSYSNLQNAISGAQNPLMMGIGGMLRRP
jgi:hypothetical protein